MKRTPLDQWIVGKVGASEAFASRANLEAYQLRRLRDTLELVTTKSGFYRRHLPRVEVGELVDVRDLPFTTADDLRTDPLRFLCVSQDEISRVVTLDTSGTTGPPKRVHFTPADQELTVDFFSVGMSTFTAAGDRVLILLPGETPGSVGDLLATALERLGAVPIKHGPPIDAAVTLEVIRGGVDVMVGVPTHVHALALMDASPRVSSVLLTTDNVPDAIVRTVEDSWGCVVYNHYGMTEMGLGGGVECEAREGYHLREADMLFEVVDPENGDAMADGEYGEVVFSTLTRRGMPLVRYRTGDVSRFLAGRCQCGTELKRLENVRFRLDGRIPLGDGHLTMDQLDEALFSIRGVVNFTATLHEGYLDLRVKAAGPVERAAIADSVSSIPAVKDVDVHVALVDDLRLSPGKRRITDPRT